MVCNDFQFYFFAMKISCRGKYWTYGKYCWKPTTECTQTRM